MATWIKFWGGPRVSKQQPRTTVRGCYVELDCSVFGPPHPIATSASAIKSGMLRIATGVPKPVEVPT